MEDTRIRSFTRESTAAWITAAGLLVMAILAAIANFVVIAPLTVSGDAAATATNVMNAGSGVRLAALGLLVVAIIDVIVAWGLHIVFRNTRPDWARLMAWIRVVYATVFIVVIAGLFDVIRDVAGEGTMALFYMERFHETWQMSLVVFGIHLILLGILLWERKVFSIIVAVLLVLAGLGYMVDGIGTIVSKNYSLELATFTFVGEVLLIVWLPTLGRTRSNR